MGIKMAGIALGIMIGVAGWGWTTGWLPRPGQIMRHMMTSHSVPDAYATLRNPLVADEATLRRGAELYQTNCASCHGASGQGDGPVAASLQPSPANLARAVQMPMVDATFLYWRVSEGALTQKSAMPPFKEMLSEEERWQIVTFVETL